MPAIIDASNSIDINVLDSILSADQADLKAVHDKFYAGVEELKLLLLDNAILFCPTSMGKDSTTALLMALEAYRELISTGQIEASRPLISSTVNTGMESIVMNLYVVYARKRLLAYAKQHNINLQHEIIMPPLNDQYFVRFVGGQKLIPNSSRAGDCSIILKIKPSEAFVKSVLAKTQHQGVKVIAVVGSRTEESARRAGNMRQQGIGSKSINDLRDELTQINLGSTVLHNFAPLRDWSTDDVFSFLRIAGAKPLTKTAFTIPAFLSSHGLLVELYGNGSRETCSIAIGQATAGAGCNGKARFGCTQCSMIGAIDQSSTALAQYERWRVLGVENATRLRDYLFRLSTDMNARAFHARAYDSAAFSRIALQPNTLKPKHLEKLVRYAAQLTLDSKRAAKEFRDLVSQGREMDHPGMREIADDVNLPPKTKAAFLEMYREGITDPRNLNYLFDTNHAILLSFRWAIDGIGAAPFRPLAILRQLESGQGWLPYPQLNSEIEQRTGQKVKIVTGDLPEAIMFPVFKHEDAAQFAAEPIDALSLWSRPADITDTLDEEMNCTISRKASHHARADITFTPAATFVQSSMDRADIVTSIDGQNTGFRLRLGEHAVLSAKLNGKVLSGQALAMVLRTGLTQAIQDHVESRIDAVLDAAAALDLTGTQEHVEGLLAGAIQTILGDTTITRSVRHLRTESLFTGYHAPGRKIDPTINFTRRVARIRKGKIQKGNTRLSFYGLTPDSRLHRAHAQYTDLLVPDFNTYTQKHVQTHDLAIQANYNELVMENIHVSENGLARWIEMDGLDRAIATHDAFFERKISQRHRRHSARHPLRVFGGTYPAECLLEAGVITVAKTYYSQYQYIVRRTQFFDSLGLFCFQSMDHASVLAHTKGLTMAQHRADKAKILAHVRDYRNLQRQQARLALQAQQQGDYREVIATLKHNLTRFEHIAEQSVVQMSSGLASALFHLRFHTHDVSAVDMANINQLWCQLHLGATTADQLLASVLTPAQQRNLTSSTSDYLAATSFAAEMANRLSRVIDSQLQCWSGTLDKLSALLSRPCTDGKAPISAYRAIIECSPYALDGHDNMFWNPSLTSFNQMLAKNLARITENVTLLSDIQANLRAIASQGRRQVTRKLSLASKLSVLTQRAA